MTPDHPSNEDLSLGTLDCHIGLKRAACFVYFKERK
jgi:hypothetical protein